MDEMAQSVGVLANMIKFYSQSDERFGVNDHSTYYKLGLYGHCSKNQDYPTSVDVIKCIDRTSDVNSPIADNYKCLSLLPMSGISAVIEDKYMKMFEKLNGCYSYGIEQGENMRCCLGAPQQPLTICKSLNEELTCPLNSIGDYCIISVDCVNGAVCNDGLCVLSDQDTEGIIMMVIRNNDEVRYWLYKLFDIKIVELANFEELLEILYDKLISKFDDSEDLKLKIQKYAMDIDIIDRWIRKILNIDTNSLDDICDTFTNWIENISEDVIDEYNLDEICEVYMEDLRNIIQKVQHLDIFDDEKFDAKKTKKRKQDSKSILFLHDMGLDMDSQHLSIYALITLNFVSSTALIIYCCMRWRNKGYQYRSVEQSCSTDDE